MAKSYGERNQDSIRQFGKSLYERRMESASKKGLSKAQARGHARVSKGEKPVSQIKSNTPKLHPTPKVGTRHTTIRKGNMNTITKTNSTRVAESTLRKMQGTTERGVQRRVYIKVFDPKTGDFKTIYKGNRQTAHGISVDELNNRIQSKIDSGQATTYDEAFRQTIAGDDSGYGGNDSDDEGTIEDDFTQVQMYFIDPVANYV